MSFAKWIEKQESGYSLSDKIMMLRREPKTNPTEASIKKNHNLYHAGYDAGYNLALRDVLKILIDR